MQSVPLEFQVSVMRKVNSTLSSNSWGGTNPNLLQINEYDKYAYENPDILWVFAAGNSYYYVASPGASKNVFNSSSDYESLG